MRDITLQVPLNRVEGDLDVQVKTEGGVVTDAWSSGIMYRGFENLLTGRAALDGLVITPRICGICGTAHLMAAAQALEAIAGCRPPENALRLRCVALGVEKIQSDLRHGFLMFAPDFTNAVYASTPLYAEAARRYTPLKGAMVRETVRETKRLIEIIALIGGQWPHSSYMVPGGVTAVPSADDLIQCRFLLRKFKAWYERRILGCSIETWRRIRSHADLVAWLKSDGAHRNSEIGFFIRYAKQIGLERMGRGHANFISFQTDDLLPATASAESPPKGPAGGPGFARRAQAAALDQDKIAEHVACSWYQEYDGGRHPFEGETQPYATGQESKKYSWAKAPRYEGLPAETGPLAQRVVAQDPLFINIINSLGPNAYARQLARLTRPAMLMPQMEAALAQISIDGPFYRPPGSIPDGRGFGLVEATRGALGHWVCIQNGKIQRYQIITPTAWNASPRDGRGVRGPWEEALIGTPIGDEKNPVALGHVIRSFDACLYCTVHVADVAP